MMWQSVGRAKELGRVTCRIDDDKYLIFSHPSQPNELSIDMYSDNSHKEVLEFLNYDKILIKCHSEGPEAEKWFTEAIGKPSVLVKSYTKPPIAVFDIEKNLADEYVKRSYTMNAGH